MERAGWRSSWLPGESRRLADSQLEFLLKSIVSIVPVGVFFWMYHRNFVFDRSFLWQSKTFFYGVLSSAAAILIASFLPRTNSDVLKAFVYAALVEEILRFAVIYLRVRKSSEQFTVTEGIFDGVLTALGFAFAENLHYSVNSNGYLILLRCVSAVPMHVFAGGVMAYFLSYRQLCREQRRITRRFNWFALRRTTLAVWALAIPVAFHGVFDLVIFKGGAFTYFLVPLLIAGWFVLEFLSARSRSIPDKTLLEILDLDADEMEVISRQKEYEKWIVDYQREENDVPLIINQWSRSRTAIACVFFLISVAFLGGTTLDRTLYASMGFELHTGLSLTVVLPFMLGLFFLLGDKINYLYFRENMLRVPTGALIQIKMDDGTTSETMVYDILPRGVFLSGIENLVPGEKVTLRAMTSGRFNVSALGRAQWVNSKNKNLPSGTLIQFLKPGPGFMLFAAIHGMRKVWKRLRPVGR